MHRRLGVRSSSGVVFVGTPVHFVPNHNKRGIKRTKCIIITNKISQ
jgi:hypothetical protein